MGDVDELSRWLEEGYAAAYRTARLILRTPADAEEAVQEAYLRVWRFRDAIPGGEGRRAWLYRVVVNTCISRLRAQAARPAVPLDGERLASLAGSDRTAVDPATSAERAELADAVMAALGALPDTLRVPVVLRYWTGLAEKEIATAIQRRPGTVKSRLSEARRRLAADPRLQSWTVDLEEAR